MYGYICPDCGAYLDPGETCDCIEERKEHEEKSNEAIDKLIQMLAEDKDGQLKIAI